MKKRASYILAVPVFVLLSVVALIHKLFHLILTVVKKVTRLALQIVLVGPYYLFLRPLMKLLLKVLWQLKVNKGYELAYIMSMDDDVMGYAKRATILHETD